MSQPHGPARDAGSDAPTGAPAGQSTARDTGARDTGARDAGQREAAARGYVPRPAQSYDDDSGYAAESEPRGAVIGLSLTAAVLMVVSGLWSFLEGLAAIIKGQFFVVSNNYVYQINTTAWGWIHLVLGVFVFVAGAFLFLDKTWARVAGVVLACISAVISFLYIPYQPVWSFAVIVLDIFIVWALLSPRSRYSSR